MVIAGLLLKSAFDCRFWPRWSPAYPVASTIPASNGLNFAPKKNGARRLRFSFKQKHAEASTTTRLPVLVRDHLLDESVPGSVPWRSPSWRLGTTRVLRRDMKGIRDHVQQVGKSTPLGSRKRITMKLSSGVGMSREMKGLEVSTVDTRWKLMSGARELRGDVVHVVRHAAQDGVDDDVGGIAALGAVAVNLLDPFEVDDGTTPMPRSTCLETSMSSVFTRPCRPS